MKYVAMNRFGDNKVFDELKAAARYCDCRSSWQESWHVETADDDGNIIWARNVEVEYYDGTVGTVFIEDYRAWNNAVCDGTMRTKYPDIKRWVRWEVA